MQDKALDRLLAEAASAPPVPSPALIDRVLADALALQPAPPTLALPAKARASQGIFARLAGAFGGAPGLASVSAAAILGLAIGYLNPATLDSIASGLNNSGTEEFFPSVDFLTDEG